MKVSESIIPRKWQTEALSRWRGGLRGVAQVVTGGGKTVFAYLCLEEFFRRFPDGRAIIIVPTIALLDQWLIDICESTDLDECDLSTYSGEGHAESPGKVNILVLNTARTVAPEVASGTTTFLIVDECHRAGSPENARALDGDHAAVLGLSATPERECDEGFDEHIAPALGPIIYKYAYRQAREDEVIVDFDLVNIEVSADSGDVLARATAIQDLSSPVAAKKALKDKKLREARLLKATSSAQSALRAPWAVKLALAHRSQRVLIFHERVDSLSQIVSLLARHGQNSVEYHSHLAESHRRDNLRLFRRGIVNILVTCRALDEGANVPEANIAIVARSTSSTRQRIQRLGRVLRHASDKELATVYTLYSGTDEQERLAEEADGLVGVASVRWMRGSVS